MELSNKIFFEVKGDKYAFLRDNMEILMLPQNIKEEDIEQFLIFPVHPQNVEKKHCFSAKNISNVSVNLVNGCNLNCKYCYIGAYQRENNKLSESDFKKIINFFIKQGITNLDFYFSGGGEPLINFELLKNIPSISNEMGIKKLAVEINTNGTLITQEIADFFKENNFLVNVSIDGPKEVHNITRKYHTGKGSFDDVMRGLNILKQYKVNFACKTVLLPNSKNIIEIFDFFENNQLPLVFDIATPSTTGHYKPLLEDIDNFSNYFSTVIDKYIHKIKNNQKIFSLKIFNDLRKIHKRTWRNKGCKACYNSIYIEMNGDIYPCLYHAGKDVVSMGNIYTGIDFKTIIEKERYAKNIDEYPACKECWLKYICGGGCFAIKWIVNGNTTEPHQYLCKYLDMYWKNIIRLYIETYKFITDEKNINNIN